MDKTRLQLTDDLWLDARRAAWLPMSGVLAVADLHLGYAWAGRRTGHLLPVGAPDQSIERLLQLQQEYSPEVLVVLGDVVHRAVPIPQLRDELDQFFSVLTAKSRLVLIRGNHDRQLSGLLAQWKFPVDLAADLTCGEHLLTHGDAPLSKACKRFTKTQRSRILMGHEHPAVSVGDGIASCAKCPCFLVSETVVILPAFSAWAAGTVFPRHPFMSPLAQAACFTHAVAIMGDKLLPLPYKH